MNLVPFPSSKYQESINFKSKPVESTFIYTNDTHGTISAFPNLISGVCTTQSLLSKKNPLTLSSGDELLYWNTLNRPLENKRRNMLVEFLNMMNFDALTIGNHELDSGVSSLASVLKNAKFKTVSANVKYQNTQLDQIHKSGKFTESTIIKNKDGEKYGIIGIAPIDEFSSEISGDTKDFIAGIPIDYGQPDSEIQKRINSRYDVTMNAVSRQVKALEEKGVNKIVLLSHLGYVRDKEIVNDPRINGVDVILGGHSHDKLEGFVDSNDESNNFQNVFQTPEGRPIVVTQAGCNAEYFGVLNLFFDKNGIIETEKSGKIKGQNTLFKSADFRVTPSISHKIDSIMKKVFDGTPEIGIVKNPIVPVTSRDRENVLLTTTLDAFLTLAKEKGTEDINNLDFAMINSSTVRASIPKGKLNEGVLSLSFAFVAPMSKVDASEKQIVDVIKYSLESGNKKGKYDIPQFSSGIKYQMFESVSKEGKKHLELSGLEINGEQIDIDHPSEKKKFKAAVREIFTDTKYYGDAFKQQDGEEVPRCCDNNGKPLDYMSGLADFLRTNSKSSKNKEIHIDMTQRNIEVKQSPVSFCGRLSLVG